VHRGPRHAAFQAAGEFVIVLEDCGGAQQTAWQCTPCSGSALGAALTLTAAQPCPQKRAAACRLLFRLQVQLSSRYACRPFVQFACELLSQCALVTGKLCRGGWLR
jgi:hypothetical protein